MIDKSLKQTTIRLPSDLKHKIQQQADEMGESFNGMILIICDKFISNHQKK